MLYHRQTGVITQFIMHGDAQAHTIIHATSFAADTYYCSATQTLPHMHILAAAMFSYTVIRVAPMLSVHCLSCLL